MRLQALPKELLPREKARRQGLSSLSEAELLALLLGSGVAGHNALEVATDLLIRYGGLAGLASADYRGYAEEPGLSLVRSLALGASFELARRLALSPPGEAISLKPEELALRFRPLFRQGHGEAAFLILLDGRHHLLKQVPLGQGNDEAVAFSATSLLSEALQEKARSFILVHNHPSGLALPSQGEIALTVTLAEKAAEFHLRLIDHLIVAPQTSFSFAGNGLLRKST
jgi:DNA repair protein RadC